MVLATEQQIVAAALALKGQHDALESERAKLNELQAQRDAIVAQIAAQRDRVQAKRTPLLRHGSSSGPC